MVNPSLPVPAVSVILREQKACKTGDYNACKWLVDTEKHLEKLEKK